MKNKIVIGGLIGFIYALIPLLGVISWGNKGGDPGPGWVLMIPLFWPMYITIALSGIIIHFLFTPLGIDLSSANSTILLFLFNVFIWTLIGIFIGIMRQKNTERYNEK